MPTQTDIPEQLKPQVLAACDWLNQSQGTSFSVTGVVNYDDALVAKPGDSFRLGIVLCDGEICTREKVQITPVDDGYEFSRDDTPDFEMPAELDPPPGLRKTWFEEQLQKQDFLLLLFYRGRW